MNETEMKSEFQTDNSNITSPSEKEIQKKCKEQDFDLCAKRKEFQKKMELLEARRLHVIQKQKELDERVSSFETYLLENKIKRHRTSKMLEQEQRLITLLWQKHSEYQNNMFRLKERHRILSELLKSHTKYEEFFEEVLATLPKEYIKLADNPIQGLMTRYENLIESGKSVLQSLFEKAERTDKLAHEFSQYVTTAQVEIMTLNSKITESQKLRFQRDNELSMKEEQMQLKAAQVRSQLEFFGIVLRAIDNITEKCLKRSPTSQTEKGNKTHLLKDMEPEEKFTIISDYLMDAQDLVSRVEVLMANVKGSEPSDVKIKKNKKRTKTAVPDTIENELTEKESSYII